MSTFTNVTNSSTSPLSAPDQGLSADDFVLKAVYSFLFPEVLPFVDREHLLGSDLNTWGVSEQRALELLTAFGLPDIQIPVSRGAFQADEAHVPVLDEITRLLEPVAPGLSRFKYSYPLHGSSPGIFHSMARYATTGFKTVNVFAGDYEGYTHTATQLGLEVSVHPLDTDSLPVGLWFVSNPFAGSGDQLDDAVVDSLVEAGSTVVLDLAYAGTTDKPVRINPGLAAAVVSMSKSYGLFRWRIGWLWSPEPVDSLYATCWFKDLERLYTGLLVMRHVPPGSLYKRYKALQQEAVALINDRFDASLTPSDSFLLAQATEPLPGTDDFLRGSVYRYCLTPALYRCLAEHQ